MLEPRSPAIKSTILPLARAASEAPRTRGVPERIVAARNARGVFGERVTRFPFEHAHGARPLLEVLAARGEALAALTGDAALADFDPRAATFLDIETTGLSGGAGTHVFLVGLLTCERDGFELWQGFLSTPEEAPALLEACAQRVRSRGTLVSFFGKSFDRHRLEDRMRLHGVEPPFAGRAHLDLYHPCRRLYGACFSDARLATMERELAGVRRSADLPGAFAPAAWFDFLAGREHQLEAVFRHNEWDVLSLASLCAHVAELLAPRPEGTERADDARAAGEFEGPRALALARMFTERRDWARAFEWSERARRAAPASREALAFAARALDRLGRRAEACDAFERVAEGVEDGLAAESWAELGVLAAALPSTSARSTLARAAIAEAERLIPRTLTGTRAARAAKRLAQAKRALDARERRAAGSAEGLAR